jgi:hypothetical protein
VVLGFLRRLKIMKRISKLAALAGFSVLGFFATTATHAATTLPEGVTSTDVDGSGWNVTPAEGVSLLDPSLVDGTLVFQEKDAIFTADAPLGITFTQSGSSAASSVAILTESVTNNTGTSWSGFEFLLVNFADNSDSSFSKTFTAPTGYSLSSSTGTDIIYSGSQANLGTLLFGPGSELLIDANPLGIGTTFVFKEIPVVGPLVPLPAAVWQGLGGLLTLGLIGLGKKKLFA